MTRDIDFPHMVRLHTYLLVDKKRRHFHLNIRTDRLQNDVVAWGTPEFRGMM